MSYVPEAMSSGMFLIWTKMGEGVLVFSSKYPVMSVALAPVKWLFSSPLPVEAQVFVASHNTVAPVEAATPLVSRIRLVDTPPLVLTLFQFADATVGTPATSVGSSIE